MAVIWYLAAWFQTLYIHIWHCFTS